MDGKREKTKENGKEEAKKERKSKRNCANERQVGTGGKDRIGTVSSAPSK
jgi:hypothetical protein